MGRMEGFAPGPDETLDVLACGGLGVFQKREGYRYSLDAYLLAAFVDEGPGTRVLEIGSGSGVVAMMLASLKGLLVMGVEIQRELAEMSMRSVGRAGLEGKVGVVCADIRDYRGPKVDVVVTNPPYRPKGKGRVNPNRQKALARHEISLDLGTLMSCSRRLLRHRGRFYIVYPSWRIADLFCAMRTEGIEPKRLRCVHTWAHSTAEICLVCGTRGGGTGLVLEAPLMVYNEDGSCHEGMERVLRELRFDKKALTDERAP